MHLNLNDKQIAAIAKLLGLSVKKEWYLTLNGQIVSTRLINSVYGTNLQIWFCCYCHEDKTAVEKYGLSLQNNLLKGFGIQAIMKPLEGYTIQKDGYALGTKYDVGVNAKESISFPEDFYDYPPIVFFSKEKAFHVLRKVVRYAAQIILTRGKWGGVYCKEEIKKITKL